jgi:Papain-like cysteine protease AvrRpt2
MRRAGSSRSAKAPAPRSRVKGTAKSRQKAAMSIIERTRIPLAPLARAAARAKPAGPAKGQSHRLDFRIQHQRHSNWCWAAVAASVALFYRPARKWTQCAVANSELGRKDCCRKGAGGKCNLIGHLQDSLTVVGHATTPPFVVGTVGFDRAQAEIDSGRPLGARTQWAGGGTGHFVTIVGYHSAVDLLTVDDPLYGRSHVDYRTFCTDYRRSGTWTHSYYTKR